jgi:hypothetical protein
MSNSAPGRIAVTFNMTADDYAKYFAVLSRRESSWTHLFGYLTVFFAAIPVALAFRSIGQHLSVDSAAVELIGYLSLTAFLLGIFATIAAGVVVRRIAVKRHLTGTLNAFESKTAVFDATGLTLTGQISQANWQWAAVSSFSNENDLFLIWIARSSAVAIPRRSFGSDQASRAADTFIRARVAEAARPPATAG